MDKGRYIALAIREKKFKPKEESPLVDLVDEDLDADTLEEPALDEKAKRRERIKAILAR